MRVSAAICRLVEGQIHGRCLLAAAANRSQERQPPFFQVYDLGQIPGKILDCPPAAGGGGGKKKSQSHHVDLNRTQSKSG